MKNVGYFINYDKEDNCRITVLFEIENGIVPVVYEESYFLSCYPHLAKKMIEGNTIYIRSNSGFVGKILSEGPYGEVKVFLSEYESYNMNFNEILHCLNSKIKYDKKHIRKLVKIGESYR